MLQHKGRLAPLESLPEFQLHPCLACACAAALVASQLPADSTLRQLPSMTGEKNLLVNFRARRPDPPDDNPLSPGRLQCAPPALPCLLPPSAWAPARPACRLYRGDWAASALSVPSSCQCLQPPACCAQGTDEVVPASSASLSS